MNKLKWLLVGAGDIARKRVAPALSVADNSEISGICDLDRASAESLAGEFKVDKVFTDFSEALSGSGANAVYLAVPVSLHVPIAVEALRADKHVLVEKPLGLTARECAPLLEMAEKSHGKAGCAYFRRFFPRYHHAKAMLDSDEFGRVTLIRMVYFSWFAPSRDDPKYWRVVRDKSGGGPLSDMGTHMFDLLIGLFGLPVSVFAKCDNQIHRWEVEDSAAILMKMSNGAHVTASFNWNSKTWRHEFEIVGTEAKLDWLPFDSGPVVKTVGRETESIDLPSADNVHLPLVEGFIKAVLCGEPFACDLAEALKTNILLDAVYRSVRENREIQLDGSHGIG